MDLFTTIAGSAEKILGVTDIGDGILSGSSGFPDVGDFLGGLGDTVGPASSLLGLAQKASGALSGVLGGGGGSGEMGGSPTGFVQQKNTEVAAAKDYQSRLALQQVAERERSKEGQKDNPHSRAIVGRMFERNPNGVKAAGNALMSVALKSGSRAELRARAK